MGYPVVGAEGEVTSWGAAGFYANLIAAISPNQATITEVCDEIETTPLGSGVGRFIPGLRSWSGSITANAFATPRLGNVGLVTWSAGGYALHVESFDLTLEAGSHDITSFSGTPPTYRIFRPDYVRGSGTFNARIDSETSLVGPHAPGATLPTLTLTYGSDTSANAISGPAMIQQMQANMARGSLSTVAYSFRFVGTITPSGTSSLFGTTAFGIPLWASDGDTTNTLLTLTAASGKTFSGDAFWTRIGLRCAVGESPEVTVDFQGSGALTIA